MPRFLLALISTFLFAMSSAAYAAASLETEFMKECPEVTIHSSKTVVKFNHADLSLLDHRILVTLDDQTKIYFKEDEEMADDDIKATTIKNMTSSSHFWTVTHDLDDKRGEIGIFLVVTTTDTSDCYTFLHESYIFKNSEGL